MDYMVFDVEADGLLGSATRIHCLVYAAFKDGIIESQGSLTRYEDMHDLFARHADKKIVGHNVVQYDLPLLARLANVEVPKGTAIVDTLALSFHLYPVPRFKHGLEAWGERVGIAKPEVEDWQNLSEEVYIHRCEQDVMINNLVFKHLHSVVEELYSGNTAQIQRLYQYLQFKMCCLRDQAAHGIRMDKYLAMRTKATLEYSIREKTELLRQHMPRVAVKRRPKVMRRKDGSLSVHGAAWLEELRNANQPEDSEYLYESGNPTSTTQLTEWLLSLGWEPQTYRDSKQTGRHLPQVSLPNGGGICPSVRNLYDAHPYLQNLEDLYMERHRLGLVKSFLHCADADSRVVSGAHGLTNTMRLQHSNPVVNLPGVGKPYGKEIRALLTVDREDEVMCGADISALEDSTKQHYIYFFDPDYVREMRVPGFDPHMDIAKLAGLVSEEEDAFYKGFREENATEEEKLLYKELKKRRGQAKQINFGAVYGAGVDKIASMLKCGRKFAEKLFQTYWSRNHAVKLASGSFVTKTVAMPFTTEGEKLFVFNPVSGFWLPLRAEKDKFSTINQSSGVYVFDTWLKHCRKLTKQRGLSARFVMQYHDELLLVCSKDQKDSVETLLHDAMERTNDELRLNVPIGISTSWGRSYAECH